MDPSTDQGPDLAADKAMTQRARFRAAAIEAELATGRRESSDARAHRNIVFRLVIIVVGTIVSLAGLSMMVLPGPGIVVTLVGLGILAREFAWADRLLRTFRKKSRVDDIGRLPMWAQVLLGLVSIAAVVASLVYVVIR